MPDVQAVVFDIGNVLIEWQPERWYDKVVGRDRRIAMFETVPLHELNDRSDLGEDMSAVMAEAAEAYPEFANEIKMWSDRWIELATPAIDHSVRLLRALRRNDVPVFALTNFGVQTLEIADKEYPFLEEFDKRYVSGAMKVIKPDPEIYRMVEEDCGVPAAGLLFADDRADNIEAASARGWQTHLFEHPEGWAERLVAEGLLTAEEAV